MQKSWIWAISVQIWTLYPQVLFPWIGTPMYCRKTYPTSKQSLTVRIPKVVSATHQSSPWNNMYFFSWTSLLRSPILAPKGDTFFPFWIVSRICSISNICSSFATRQPHVTRLHPLLHLTWQLLWGPLVRYSRRVASGKLNDQSENPLFQPLICFHPLQNVQSVEIWTEILNFAEI